MRDKSEKSLKKKYEENLWIEADRSYCHIFLDNGRKITQSLPMKAIEQSLPPSDFCRIHRSFIINMLHVSHIVGNCIYIGKQNFGIGREYRDSLYAKLTFVGVQYRAKRTKNVISKDNKVV